jgi:hypothetical protein
MKTAFKLGLVVLIVWFLYAIIPDKDKRNISVALRDATAVDPSNPSPKDVALRDTKLDFHWAKSGFGSVMIADFKVQNPTPYRFKDFEVTCTDYGKSGTEIDTNKKTIYEIVQPKSTKSVKHVNMGFMHSQTDTSGCQLTDLVIDVPPNH